LDKLVVFSGFAPEIEVKVIDDSIEIIEWKDKLTPVSDLTFYSNRYNRHRAFGRNSQGRIAYFYPSGTKAYHKLKWYEPVKFQIFWVGSIVFLFLISIVITINRFFFKSGKQTNTLHGINFGLAFIAILFLGLLPYGLTQTDLTDFLYGLPIIIRLSLILPILFIPIMVIGILVLIRQWRKRTIRFITIIYQLSMLLTDLSFILWLNNWNLVGFKY
jgi:hypothetical protein